MECAGRWEQAVVIPWVTAHFFVHLRRVFSPDRMLYLLPPLFRTDPGLHGHCFHRAEEVLEAALFPARLPPLHHFPGEEQLRHRSANVHYNYK